jgi:hypothetical protein
MVIQCGLRVLQFDVEDIESVRWEQFDFECPILKQLHWIRGSSGIPVLVHVDLDDSNAES